MRVVAGIVGQLAKIEVGDARDDRVEKEPVVRDEDHGVRICREILLEPVPRLEIEMVGRLVEQQQRRPAEQQLRERKPHLPAARQRVGGLLERLVAEAEPAKHRRDLQIDAVALFDAKAILQRAVALEHRLVLCGRHRWVAEPLLDGVHLVLDVEQIGERGARLVEDRSSGVVEAVLRQIADRERRGLDDLSLVGPLEPRHHLQQRRLAGAVGAAQPDALAGRDLPGHVFEERALAERFCDGGKLEHSDRIGYAGSPIAFAAAASTCGTRNGLVR